MKKLLVIIIVIAMIGLIMYIAFNDSDENKIDEDKDNVRIENGEIVENKEKEKEIKKEKAEEIFKNIPKMYVEEISPFSEEFKLNAAMEKITMQSNLLEVEADFSEKNVNKALKELFGKEATLNKEELTIDKIETSMYYYSEETNTYEVLPMGFNGVYLEQSLIKATETKTRLYVYTYCLVGEYMVDESGKINAVIGDKDGNDLELSFDEEIISKKWIEEYKEKLPVFRYTFDKNEDNTYLIAVEQVN